MGSTSSSSPDAATKPLLTSSRSCPGFRVVHIEAGPRRSLPISSLCPAWSASSPRQPWPGSTRTAHIRHQSTATTGYRGGRVFFSRRNLALPLANSFHTLGRVKGSDPTARSGPRRESFEPSPRKRSLPRSDCVVASTPYEFDELMEHYAADPARLCTSPPGHPTRGVQAGRQGSRPTLDRSRAEGPSYCLPVASSRLKVSMLPSQR